MTRVVLDASALLALIFDEPGAEIVSAHLDQALISAVNYSETATKIVERGADLDQLPSLMATFDLDIVAFGEQEALEAARLRPATREFGLSLGDRACLALGASTRRTILTTDTAWTKTGLPIDIRLIR